MIVWLLLTCHGAAVLSVWSHCQCLWGNWMFLESMCTMSMSSLLTPLFCSTSDASLFFFQIHTFSCLGKTPGLVCTRDSGDGDASHLLLLISQGPHGPQGDHMSLKPKPVVFLVTLPVLWLFSCHPSLVGIYASVASCHHSEDLGLLLGADSQSVLGGFCLGYFLLCVCF